MVVMSVLHERLGHDFVSSLRTLKPKKTKYFFLKNLGFPTLIY